MKISEIIERITEFNKFAEELFNLSFVKKLENSGYRICGEKGKRLQVELRGPDDESIKAFINDIRRFFQKGDDTLKIHKLIPVYQSELIAGEEKKIFNGVMRDFDKFNNKTTGHTINNEIMTNEKVFQVFMYGRFSHRSKGIKEIHDDWEKVSLTYIPLKNEFITILCQYLIFINNIVYANKKVLKKLGN